MSEPYRVGTVTDEHSNYLEVYVTPGTVTLSINDAAEIHLSDVLMEDLQQLIISACWQAGAHGGDA